MNDEPTRPTLCWICRHAVPKTRSGHNDGDYIQGCDWSIWRCKVPGWTAIEGTIPMGRNRDVPSFTVIECPKFERG